MEIDKLLPEGAIRPSHLGVHLGCFRIGVSMVVVHPSDFLVELLHELRTIVG
jgi:hypothetical protein